MLGLPRTTALVASSALGSLLIYVFATGLIRVVRRASVPHLRLRLFLLILGIVVGAWFFTFGTLSLVLGI